MIIMFFTSQRSQSPTLSPHNITLNEQPSRNSREASHQLVENWLTHTSAEYSVGLSYSLKRKRSRTPSPPPDHQSLLQRSPKGSLEGDMDQSRSETVVSQPAVITVDVSNGFKCSSTPSRGANSSSVSKDTPKTPSHITFNDMHIKIPKDAAWVKRRLRVYRCYQNEPDALEQYPAFRKKILDIVDGERLSFMSAGSAKKFSLKLGETADDNEDTFLHHILPTIIKESRSIKSRVPDKALGSPDVVEALEQLQSDTEAGDEDDWEELLDSEMQDKGNHEHEQHEDEQSRTSEPETGQACAEDFELVVEEFAQSGVTVKVNRELRKDFLPHQPNKPDTELHKAMAKVNGMKNAKPDRVYGIKIDKYPIPDDVDISVLINILLETIPLLHWPFFIIEGKSDAGSQIEAANQACRGGASIINASQGLLKEIGEPRVSDFGPDTRTFMFSATISPTVMEIWVHWAEYRGKEHTLFHMHKLRVHSLGDDNTPGKLRKIIHNILDWGCGERFEGIKQVYDKIFDYERKRLATEDVSNSGQGSEGSPQKKQRTR